jgi:Arc/MetJ-type ribon-helix-helix transcriptional regulator
VKKVAEKGTRMKIVTFHIPKRLLQEVEAYVGKGYPFKSRSALFRRAVQHLINIMKVSDIPLADPEKW